jgi:lipopolysaccharide export system permease protein
MICIHTKRITYFCCFRKTQNTLFKKLDRLVLGAFIGPFIATLVIVELVLVIQFFWLYIDDFVGKGLEVSIILQMVMYMAATLFPLALPLAILLSSIMTFGNMGESFELVAIKSAGIPLLRFMRPLLIFAIFMGGIAFLFQNYVIPVANLKSNRLKYDIINKKPAFDLKEGVFYNKIPGFAMKVGKKEKDDSTIRNIIIYENSFNSLQDNLITAKEGIMKVSADKQFLEFTLKDGWRYQEQGSRMTANTELIRLGFKQYKKVLDMSSFQIGQTSDSAFKDNWRMLSIRQLNKNIDSLETLEAHYQKVAKDNLLPYLTFMNILDTGWVAQKTMPNIGNAKRVEELLPDSARSLTMQHSIEQVISAKNGAEILYSEYNDKEKSLRFHLIEWHRKFSLSFACIVLFFIGAPLGSIIRKGGIGLPLVFSIVFFVIFHLLNTFGEKFSKEGTMPSKYGMWLATFILVPIGIFLTNKAMKDSQLFNGEFYFRHFRKLYPLFERLGWKKKATA